MSFKPIGMTAAGFLAAGITVFGATGIIVSVRIHNSYVYAKRLFLDDYLAVFAWILQVVNFGVYIELFLYIEHIATTPIRQFTQVMPPPSAPPTAWYKHSDNKPQFVIAESFIGGFAIYFAKVPVLVLFDRLFGIRKWVRVTVWTTTGAGLAIFLASLLYVSVECSAAKVHDAADQIVCMDSASTNGLVHGTASLVLDVIAFIIPVPIVLNLHISKSKKIGLGAVFAAGILAITVSTVALYYKIAVALGNAVSNMGTGSMILSFIEASTAIVVSCVPALRSFWTNQLPNLTVYSKLRSLFSSQSLTGSQPAQGGLSKPSADNTGQGTYIELHEANSTHEHCDSGLLRGN